jgi:hypothetical protein
MDSSPSPSWHIEVDTALDAIHRRRAELMAQPGSAQRSHQLAELADTEAACWETVIERSRTRVYWRAAQVAREHARYTAARWRHHAERTPAFEAAAAVGAAA